MLMILGIGVFFTAVYVLLTGLTVRQREVSLSVRRARRYGTRNQREIETRRSVNARVSCARPRSRRGSSRRWEDTAPGWIDLH